MHRLVSLILAGIYSVAGFINSQFRPKLPIRHAHPFQMTELSSGYMLAGKEGKCGEGKCGMKIEGKCGMKMMDADEDGAVSKEEFMQHHEKKFTQKDKNEDGQLTADEMKMMKMKKVKGCVEKENAAKVSPIAKLVCFNK